MIRVLVVKMSSLGDVVHALPAVTDACAHGAVVDWVVEEAFADIPRLHAGVQRVIPIAWRRWRRSLGESRAEMSAFLSDLRAQDYDHVIDAQGLIKSALVSLLARGRRAGFAHTSAREPWSAFAYRTRVAVPRAQHAIDRQRALFGAVLGYAVPPRVSAGLDQANPRGRRVLLLHGTTWATKHWPETMWAELVRLVGEAGMEPVVTWGNQAERERAQHLARCGATLQPRVDIAALAGLMRDCALVIGVDSGLCHLSAALGTPTVGLYGPTSAKLTGCRGAVALALQGEAHCAPCLRPQCTRYRGEARLWQGVAVIPPCFASLAPDTVWQAARGLIEQQAGQRARQREG